MIYYCYSVMTSQLRHVLNIFQGKEKERNSQGFVLVIYSPIQFEIAAVQTICFSQNIKYMFLICIVYEVTRF